jgi:hypothetical protein
MEIRKTLLNNEWWFSIVDVTEALSGSERPRRYWNDLEKKLLQEGYGELSEKIGQLKLPSSDWKLYEMDCRELSEYFSEKTKEVKRKRIRSLNGSSQ